MANIGTPWKNLKYNLGTAAKQWLKGYFQGLNLSGLDASKLVATDANKDLVSTTTVNSTSIGATTPGTGAFTSLEWRSVTSVSKSTGTGHADITLTAAEAQAFEVIVTGTADAGVNLIVPTNRKMYLVKNACGQAVTTKTAAGTGIAVATAKYALLYADGTNVVRVTADT